ncbi:transport protein Sec61 subunit beta-like [Pyrus ussuriensis x Pyrus communis]|uniref:Transport protein Sec61 subunit beta-like n=1 Tax=Pyrus ussuriensis x Pyrus communis TaxID=2448454 RepID=A0A5N5F4T4_9ROSA|nr:transport protein Sec61 subunit beta-like [Pyrus ussuriensis x Pyrus communis]
MAPRGSAAATAGMRRRRVGGSTGSGSIDGGGGRSGAGNNMLRSPRLFVLVMSLCFIGFVTALHVFGKLYLHRSGGGA